MDDKFLNDNYTPPASNNNFLKFTDNGDYTFRVLSNAITGTELWFDGKPQRRTMDHPFTQQEIQGSDTPKNGGDKSPTHFMIFAVLHDGKVKILQINQVTIQREITRLFRDEDWGDPKNYNLVVTRSANGKKISYTVSPKPHKELSEDKKQLWADTVANGFNLNAMYSGGSPFGAGSSKGEQSTLGDPDENAGSVDDDNF